MGNRVLRVLNIGENGISARGGEFLAEALKRDASSLATINLEGNVLGAQGAEHLARALSENNELQGINLDGNLIGDRGAQSLAEALSKNQTIRSLSLHGNKIRNGGAHHVAKLFETERGSLSVDLEGNWIRDGAVPSLKKSLRGNRVVHDLSLGRNILAENSIRDCAAEAYCEDGGALRNLNLLGARPEVRSRSTSVRPFGDLDGSRSLGYARSVGSTSRKQIRLHGISPRALPLSASLGPRHINPEMRHGKIDVWMLPKPPERVLH